MRRKASSCLEALKLHHRVWRHSNSTIVSGGTQTPPSCLEALKLHHRRLRCASTGGRGFSCGVVRAQGSSSLSSTPYYHLVPVLPEKAAVSGNYLGGKGGPEVRRQRPHIHARP